MLKTNSTRQPRQLRLYFIGLRHGRRPTLRRPRTRHIFKLEDERKGERPALTHIPQLKRTYFRHKADIVFFRNRPELTTDKFYAELKAKADKLADHVLQINPIKCFYNHSDKIRTFKLWEQAKIPHPEYIVLPEQADFDDYCQIVYEFIKRHDAILLRTNNEAVGNGLYSLDSTTPQTEIIRILKLLLAHVHRLKLNRKDSRIMAVKTYAKDTPLAEARVYVIGNQLLTEASHAFIIPMHLRKLRISEFANGHHDIHCFHEQEDPSMITLYREATYQLKQCLQNDSQLAKQCVQAVNVLGNNIGAIDILFCNGQAIFLEINPTFDIAADTIYIFRKHSTDIWGINTAKDLFERVYTSIYDNYWVGSRP